MVTCAKVRKSDAEELRRKLVAAGVFDASFVPGKQGEYVYFPIKKAPPGLKIASARMSLLPREKKFHTIEEALRGKLSQKELEALTRSFDVVGDIAVIEVPESLKRKENEIARAVIEVNRQVRVVAKKEGPMEGVFRTRKLKVLAGENRTETLYREHGSKMKVDVAKAYFSPRLSFERGRIASQVKKGEKILALFAGVGPFPLAIARRQPNVEIAAIELNPDAVRLMEENVKLNEFGKIIKPILGDVREVVTRRYKNWADRILMPLPKGAHEFLAQALLAAKPGCIIHFYHFGPMGGAAKEAKALARSAARKAKRKVAFVSERVVRPYSPQTEQAVIDFKVE